MIGQTYVKKKNTNLGRGSDLDVNEVFYIGLANKQLNFPWQVNGTLSGSLAPRNDTNLVCSLEIIISLRMKETRSDISRRSVKLSRVMFVLDPFGDQKKFQDFGTISDTRNVTLVRSISRIGLPYKIDTAI